MLLAKARLHQRGALPADYEVRFCHPTGVDGAFMSHFGLSREDVLSAAELPESEIPAWLLSHGGPERIQEWNRIVVNLGRPGFPMAERFPVALATVYRHIDSRGLTTVFGVLGADVRIDGQALRAPTSLQHQPSAGVAAEYLRPPPAPLRASG